MSKEHKNPNPSKVCQHEIEAAVHFLLTVLLNEKYLTQDGAVTVHLNNPHGRPLPTSRLPPGM